MSHTPGPWHRNIPPATHYNTIWSGRNTHVVRIVRDGLPDAEVEANCNLVVAAPDLLAALKGLLADPYLSDPINNDRMAPARAAVAAATGTLP